MYAKGLGVTLDSIRAYMWWDIAASQGNENAAIGRKALQKVMTSLQIDKAQQLAREWVANNKNNTPQPSKPAVKKKIAVDQYNLGRKQALGQDVTKDLVRAYMWWSIAESDGNEDAIRGLAIIEEQMTSTQVEKAKQLARECLAKDYTDC